MNDKKMSLNEIFMAFILLPIVGIISIPALIGDYTGIWKYQHPGTAEGCGRFFISLLIWLVFLSILAICITFYKVAL